jgi:hypothetical protein
MEFVRDIIDSRLLDKIDLPIGLRNRQVEIIVLPLDEGKGKKLSGTKAANAFGILSKYKNPALIPNEKDAWLEAVEDKYANH